MTVRAVAPINTRSFFFSFILLNPSAAELLLLLLLLLLIPTDATDAGGGRGAWGREKERKREKRERERGWMEPKKIIKSDASSIFFLFVAGDAGDAGG